MYVPAYHGLSPAELWRSDDGAPLPFPLSAPNGRTYYRARNALYHLLRALGIGVGDWLVAPDYHHGNEIAAIRATGADLRFHRVDRRLEPDLDDLRRLCRQGPKAILAIHYIGWPAPIEEIVAIGNEHGIPVIEDCALSWLSELGGRPLGTFGDWSLFCLYKTVAVPNGAVLVDNSGATAVPYEGSEPCGLPSLAGRTAELFTSWIHASCAPLGHGVVALKRATGRALSRAGVVRHNTFDSGFDLDAVDLAMSPFTFHLLRRFDYDQVRTRRRENFLRLRERLDGRVTLLKSDLPAGVCPLFLPVMVEDKEAAARELGALGVEVIPFWNVGDPAARAPGSDAALLRSHVIEIPLHQGLSEAHVDFLAEQLIRGSGPTFRPGATA